MQKLLQYRRLHGLIVTVAILLNLCAPAISQAVTALAGDPLALEICSISSATSSENRRAPADLAQHALKHCAMCAVHSGGAAPSAGTGPTAISSSQMLPMGFCASLPPGPRLDDAADSNCRRRP
ncbi:DUF2946 family protein, partial [Duganella callida]